MSSRNRVVFSVTLAAGARRAVVGFGNSGDKEGGFIPRRKLCGVKDALINRDNWMPRKMSAVRIMTVPNKTANMIASDAKLVFSASLMAPRISAMSPPSVTTAIVVPTAATAFVTFNETEFAGSVRALDRFAPQRLQYFNSIVYSAPQDGQNIDQLTFRFLRSLGWPHFRSTLIGPFEKPRRILGNTGRRLEACGTRMRESRVGVKLLLLKARHLSSFR